MSYRDAFNETVKLFDLRASDLAANSGIGENQISRFRHGKTDLQTASLEKLIAAMPQNAKAYFYSRIMIAASDFDYEALRHMGYEDASDRDKLALVRGLCDAIELKLMETAK